MSEDEVDLENGFLMSPTAVPAPVEPGICPRCGQSPCVCTPPACPKCGKSPCVCTEPQKVCQKCGKLPCVCTTPPPRTSVRIQFMASRDEVFKSFEAIANLAAESDNGQVSIVIEGQATEGYDANWLRNAVLEPLDEADIDGMKIE